LDRVPDLAIYPVREFTPGEDEITMAEAPLGVIEILSPSQSRTELIAKSAGYFKVGVKSYWLVLPDLKSVYVFSAPNEYDVFTRDEQLSDKLLGIELDLGEIFR
jgi:Uma2 family endonuclease